MHFKWKALPAADRDTEAQIRTFFSKKYEVYDAQQNSLHNAGVANSVQLQEILQATSDGLTNIRDRQEEQESINATLLQIVKAKSRDANVTATAFSAMTAHAVIQDQQQRQIDGLEALIQSNSNTRSDNSSSVRCGGG
jgi:hypothetical protein